MLNFFTRKILFLFILFFLFYVNAYSQLIVNTGISDSVLVAGFVGNGIKVSNISRNCPPDAYGTFSNGSTVVGIDKGSMFTNGSAMGARGPNNTTKYSVATKTQYSDPSLTAIEPMAKFDPCILTFNVVPSCSTLTIKFVFGSEEYPEWVGSDFNDAFGFFVTGPNPSGGSYNGTNIAMLPTVPPIPVSINNVNSIWNSQYYVDNQWGAVNIQYDGLTKLVTASINVIPCATYVFKVAIADAGDWNLDSGVFINQLFCSSAVTATTGSKGACIACNGTATAYAANGQPPYTYLWSPGGQTTATATGLCTGNYSVTITDQTGCFLNSNTYSVNVPTLTAGAATISKKNLNCNGDNSGKATAGMTGGTSPLSYVWNNGLTTKTISGLPAGNYSVIVQDANGCASTKTVSITQPTLLTNSVGITNIACSGSLASATVTPTGGTTGYTYLWSPGGNITKTVSGLSTGTYTTLVTDAKGCASTNTVNVTITKTPVVNITSGKTGCTVDNGTATAIPSGGPTPYTYLWSPGGQTNVTATGLTDGTYSVTVTNADGCPQTNTVTVTKTLNPTVTANSSKAGCTVANGTATANPTGGTGIYSYLWSPGGNTNQIATGLAANTYTILLSDNNGCTSTGTVSITATDPPVANVFNVLQATCGNSTGSASSSASNGTPGYNYLWLPGSMTTQNISNLTGGVYTVTVTDMNGCSDNEIANVINADGPKVTTIVNTNVMCYGDLTGSATAFPTGGTPTYTYVWNNGQTTQTATGLSAGTQVVTVTDINGCVAYFTADIAQPSFSLAATVPTLTNVFCNGGSTGDATVNTTGGTPGYTFLWNNGQTTQTVTGLSMGSYTVDVKDANGCPTTASFTISEPSILTATVSPFINVSCNGGNNGSATASAGGGTPGYTYLWNNGQTGQIATGLIAGNYSVSITDIKGCINTSTVTIAQPTFSLSTTVSEQNVSCNGESNASASIIPAGGTPGYTYLWNNGTTSQTASGLNAGSYNAIVTDANGCTTTNSVAITEPTLLTSTITMTDASCNGSANGTATASSKGGTPGYTYTWNNGQTTQTATGLAKGTYTVLVTDANGCSLTLVDSVTQPAVLATTTSQKNVLCKGDSNGIATISPTGGTPGYTYTWNNGLTTASITGIVIGNYSVLAVDANGCSSTQTFTITEPTRLISTATQQDVVCYGEANGTASVSAKGGTPAYKYIWSNGQTTAIASGMIQGLYIATVTDAHGCISTNSITITHPPQLNIDTLQTTSISCNGGVASASVVVSGGVPSYTYNWSNGMTTSAVNVPAGNYFVTISDMHGCITKDSFAVIQPLPLSLSLSGADSICPYSSSVLTATSIGGTPAYTYLWLPLAQSGQSISVSPTTSTVYTVTTTDANNCSSFTQTFTVTVLPVPTALFDTTSNGRYGSIFAFKDLSKGGTSWAWDFGDGSTSTLQNPIHTFPGGSIYSVTEYVYNQFGCTDTFKINIDLFEGIIIPNVFTPDGDGMNDVWYIPNSGMLEFHVEIFDRWGLKVFETTSDKIRWDGRTASGVLLSEGTYFYTLKAVLKSFTKDKDYSTKGTITILNKKRQ